MNIPQSELEKITEAVSQGIVASKEVDSNMWGEMKVHLNNLDNRANRLEEILLDVRDRVKIQNGRTAKLENWRSYTAGAVAIIVLLVIPAVAFLAYSSIEMGKEIISISTLIKK